MSYWTLIGEWVGLNELLDSYGCWVGGWVGGWVGNTLLTRYIHKPRYQGRTLSK